MKLRWQPFAVLTLLPMGIALADYADTAGPASSSPATADVSPEQRSLIESAERSLDQATHGVQELAIAVQGARRDGDAILATCLTDSLERARKLQAQAIGSVHSIQQAATLDAARAVASEVGKTNEALGRVLDDASRCEGGKDKTREQQNSADGETVTQVTVDNDPATAPSGVGDGPTAPSQAEPPTIVPPQHMLPNENSMDPATDVPMDMPMTPPTASPMR